MPTAALDLGLCLLIPLLNSFLFFTWSATLDSGITFPFFSIPFVGFSAKNNPVFLRHTHVSSFTHLSVPLLYLRSASAKCPLGVSLSCLASLLLWKGFACITLSLPDPVALFRDSQCPLLFPVPLPTGSLPPPVYAVVFGGPDHRPDVGFLEVSTTDFLALPVQALPPFSFLGRARSTLGCPSLFWLS